jgi:hypothetical protein
MLFSASLCLDDFGLMRLHSCQGGGDAMLSRKPQLCANLQFSVSSHLAIRLSHI